MLGVSLSPRIFWPGRQNDCDRKLLAEYGGLMPLLRWLKGLGVTHVELRSIQPEDDPTTVLFCAHKIWEAGLCLSIHGAMPQEIGIFAQTCPSLIPLLQQAGQYQQEVVITLHSYITGNDADKGLAAERTNQLLRQWEQDARHYGFRLALELNRDKKNGDPSVTCSGVLSMLAGTDPQVVGICFDFGHYYSNVRNNGEDEQSVPVAAFLERVIHTHIHGLGSGGTHFPLDAFSALPLDKYVEGLVRTKYNGIYNLELEFARYPDRSFRQVLRDSLVSLKVGVYHAEPKAEALRMAVGGAMDARYPAALASMAREIAAPQSGDGVYSFCASGQIFCVGGCKFAVDPVIRTPWARDAAAEAARAVLSQVSAVFITHQHIDHFDPAFVRQLTDLDCVWVVGHSFPEELLAESGIRPNRLCIVRPGERLELHGITAQVFEGRHFQSDGTGVSAVMYLLTVGGKRIFLPADVRDYGADRLPDIDPPDCMVANVWLGRGQACCTEDGAFEEFCDYVAYFNPKKVFLGHLLEYTRESTDMWRWEHAGRIMDGLALRLPAVPAVPLQLFQYYKI